MVNFTTVACRISSQLKWYRNYKNRLRFAKVIVKNKMSRFFMVHCVVAVKRYNRTNICHAGQHWYNRTQNKYIHRVRKKRCHFIFCHLCQILTDLQNFFTITLSSKFAIQILLNIPPSFTHVTTLPCKTVVLKNRKLHCRPIWKTFNDNEQLHNKIICSVNSHISASN